MCPQIGTQKFEETKPNCTIKDEKIKKKKKKEKGKFGYMMVQVHFPG